MTVRSSLLAFDLWSEPSAPRGLPRSKDVCVLLGSSFVAHSPRCYASPRLGIDFREFLSLRGYTACSAQCAPAGVC